LYPPGRMTPRNPHSTEYGLKETFTMPATKEPAAQTSAVKDQADKDAQAKAKALQDQLDKEKADLEAKKATLAKELEEARKNSPETKLAELQRVEQELALKAAAAQAAVPKPEPTPEEKRKKLLAECHADQIRAVLRKREQALLEESSDEELLAALKLKKS
jgi:hypothetical protein